MNLSRPMLQNLADWPRLASRTTLRPTGYALTPSEDERRRIVAYNDATGPFGTRDTRAIEAAITRAQERNEAAPMVSQHAVLVTGRPLDGKTHGVAAYALRACRDAWAMRSPSKDLNAPWIYIEVEAGRAVAGLARAIAAFIGLPVSLRASASEVLAQLRVVLPQVGTVGLIIDDAHGIAGAHNRESRAFAGALKALITGLPVTVVIVGVNLEDGALAGPRGDEVGLRGDVVRCGGWQKPSIKGAREWKDLVATMYRALEVPAGKDGMGTEAFVTLLATGSDGRPGLAIDWVKLAAAHAVTHHKPLDAAALHATSSTAHATPPTPRPGVARNASGSLR